MIICLRLWSHLQFLIAPITLKAYIPQRFSLGLLLFSFLSLYLDNLSHLWASMITYVSPPLTFLLISSSTFSPAYWGSLPGISHSTCPHQRSATPPPDSTQLLFVYHFSPPVSVLCCRFNNFLPNELSSSKFQGRSVLYLHWSLTSPASPLSPSPLLSLRPHSLLLWAHHSNVISNLIHSMYIFWKPNVYQAFIRY